MNVFLMLVLFFFFKLTTHFKYQLISVGLEYIWKRSIQVSLSEFPVGGG